MADERIARAKDGDRGALAALLEENEPRIYRFTMKLCRHPEDARGVLQETMMDAVRGIGGFREEASFTTWLYTLARNRCLKRRRKSKFAPTQIEAIDEGHELPAETSRPDEEVLSKELRRTVERAIAGLAEEQREVLVLRDVEGLSGEEAAEVLGLSLAATKSRLHRARKALREALEPVVREPAPTCPDIATVFSRNLEGDLSRHDCAAMREHLEGCAACRTTCDALESALATCQALPAPDVPPEVQESVQAAIRELLRLPD